MQNLTLKILTSKPKEARLITKSVFSIAQRFLTTYYTKAHEYIKIDEGKDSGKCGISDHAQQELGDVVFVDLPEKGRKISKGELSGAVESVKAVGNFYAPVSGKIISVNSELESTPSLINSQPEDNGWIIEVQLDDKSEINQLMNPEQYKKFLAEESHK
ncbi:glycine cleavage system h protein [Anaeramoeba ignava]|uniref:Glycine cleavage system H protein n=1 Tax=Anaeramoeba ignava TaxID=1746090 RepID=A0A9Q0L7S8_ANAIG|nr:glycine cleavage system h protein [Anaeramoeba ignava]